jgi:four helix bundle protein
MLDYENPEVYRKAPVFVITSIEIRERLPRVSGELVDQFKRASFSMVLNIAEGAGKLKQGDKQRYFSLARGSVMECVPSLICSLLYARSPLTSIVRGECLLRRIAATLSKLCPLAPMTPVSSTLTSG